MASLYSEPAMVLPPVLRFALGVPAAPRSAVEAIIERMIEALDMVDEADGHELDGDEQDGSYGEDDFVIHADDGPGCPVSDPDSAVDDRPCDEEGL